jgi:hypothetical protein
MNNDVGCPPIFSYHQPIAGYSTARSLLVIGTGQLRLICAHASCVSFVETLVFIAPPLMMLLLPPPPPPPPPPKNDKIRIIRGPFLFVLNRNTTLLFVNLHSQKRARLNRARFHPQRD